MTLELSLLAVSCLLCALGASPTVNRAAERTPALTRLRACVRRTVSRYEWFFAVALLALALLLRVLYAAQIPTGIAADEMLIAVQGRSLASQGKDLAGTWLPAFLPGYGASTAMGPVLPLLTAPFTALWGMSLWAVRLPALLLGLGSIVLCYFLARGIAGRAMALWTLLILSLSPWHIASSRFLNVAMASLCALALGCLLLSRGRWAAAGVVFALSMFVSDGLWLAAPSIFVGYAIFCVCSRRVSFKRLALPAVLFLLIAAPALCTICVNRFGLSPFSWLGITIPALPQRPQGLTTLFDVGFSFNALEDTFFSLLEWLICAVKADEYGSTGAYLLYGGGFTYLFAFPLLVGGLIGVCGRARRGKGPFVLLALMAAGCVLLRLVCPQLSLEHLYPLYLPVTLLVALCLTLITRRMRLSALGFAALYVVSGSMMLMAYFGGDYAYETERDFRSGFTQAAQFTQESAADRVVVTSRLYPCADAQRLGEAMTRFAFDLPASAVLGEDEAYRVAGLDGLDLSARSGVFYIASQEDLDLFDWDAFDFHEFGLYTVLSPLSPEEAL